MTIPVSYTHLFAWSEVGQWCYDRNWEESGYEREGRVEVFKLSRSYKELIERLELEKIDDSVDLPWDVYKRQKHDKISSQIYLNKIQTTA